MKSKKIKSIKFGGDVPSLGFKLSDWEKAYLVNGSYHIPKDDKSVFGSKSNEERKRNGFQPI